MCSTKYQGYDVTIVGAGPSGSVLAYELAKQGIRVLLLEKNKLPREKVCAGGITVRAASILPFEITDVVEDTIFGARLSYNRVPKKVRRYEKPLAYMVMRDKFDNYLVSRAREAGAAVKDGVEVCNTKILPEHVLVKTKDEDFSTPILVGADGANSVVVESMGMRENFEYAMGINSQVRINHDKLAFWDGLIGLDYGIPGGYAWVFPKHDCLSVGAGGSFRVAKRLKPYVLSLIESYQLNETQSHLIQGHLMPLRKVKSPLSRDRVLLVGDAAGMIDPLTGEGIYYAVKSAYLALPVIKKYLEGKAANFNEYDDAICRELAPEQKIARTIQKMNSSTPRLFFYFLTENDRFWRAFCRLLRGEKTYTDLKNSLSPPLKLLFTAFS